MAFVRCEHCGVEIDTDTDEYYLMEGHYLCEECAQATDFDLMMLW